MFTAEAHWYPAIADANADQRVFTYYTKRPATAADSVPTAWTAPSAHGESITGHYQRYTLNRVAHVIASQKEEPDSLVESTYSYDPHGNVEWQRQELPLLGSNWVEYCYDLLSGNMLEMRYNPGWRDALWHRYFYDEDNRLTEVKTSREGEIWDSDARYGYYAHGPLKRAEYGEDSLQGIDYTYTLQGWLKGVNHPQGALNLSGFTGGPTAYGYDPGGDQAGARMNYAPDAFGMTLHYHEGDFYRVGSAFHSEESTADAAVAATNLPALVVNGSATDLYNGNISTWTSHTVAAGGLTDETLTGHRYEYDVLNRLRRSRYEMWNGTSVVPVPYRYRTEYTYDPNGNIQTLVRYGDGTSPFDDFTYSYPSPGSNRLAQVSDAVPGPTAVPGDLEGGQGSNNYSYDASGNLIGDVQEGISSGDIEWRADGKVWRVTKTGGAPDELKFSYNASGDRVIKKVSDNGDERRLYYVREAGGKVLAVYEQVCPAPMVELSGRNIDWDGDGLTGAADPCPCEAPLDPYLGHQDTDEDGVPDECDPNPTTPGDMPSTDQDGDGNDDDHDNCMCTPNPSSSGANGPQVDSDGDGWGDECDPGCEIVLIELHVYGNGSEGRITISKPSGITRSGLRGDTTAIDVAVQPLPPLPPIPPDYRRDSILTRVLDEKVYELKDHLGNVRVVISDVKEPVSQSGEAPFGVTLRRYTNYYPFGMVQPGRSYEAPSAGEYRYGFQGQEEDGELGGDGSVVNYSLRTYDPRIGRFFSLDPMGDFFPHNSPYAFSENRVIDAIELEGGEKLSVAKQNEPGVGKPGKASITISLHYYMVTEGRGACNRNVDSEAFRRSMQLGDVTMYMVSLPTPDQEPEFLSEEHSVWARKASGGDEEAQKQLADAGIEYWEVDVAYDYQLESAGTLEQALENFDLNTENRGIGIMLSLIDKDDRTADDPFLITSAMTYADNHFTSNIVAIGINGGVPRVVDANTIVWNPGISPGPGQSDLSLGVHEAGHNSADVNEHNNPLYNSTRWANKEIGQTHPDANNTRELLKDEGNRSSIETEVTDE